ncbi:MAG: hypothetical protein KJ548_04860 [Actinobacteria bacterium]|nr:hypothetical protein [Actinomycetota bacterium]
MSTATDAGPPSGGGLRERWRATSLDSIWLRPSDWYHPAVDPLVSALVARADTLEAAEELGRARGDVGVGIGEALDDLACLYRAAELGPPPLEVVRAVAEGWADAQAGAAVNGSAMDPETGLPTHQYFVVRLAETYAEGERLSLPPARTHELVLVDVAAGIVSPYLRAARSAAVGAGLRETFGAAQPMASLGGGVFVVLAHSDLDLTGRVDTLQEAIVRRCARLEVGAVTRRPVRVWTEHLPASHEQAVHRLRRLARLPG